MSCSKITIVINLFNWLKTLIIIGSPYWHCPKILKASNEKIIILIIVSIMLSSLCG